MSKEEMALEAWNLVKKSKEEKLSDEEHDKLYKYLIVLMGDDSLQWALILTQRKQEWRKQLCRFTLPSISRNSDGHTPCIFRKS